MSDPPGTLVFIIRKCSPQKNQNSQKNSKRLKGKGSSALTQGTTNSYEDRRSSTDLKIDINAGTFSSSPPLKEEEEEFENGEDF